jgi:adenine-specific DNA-methyltransferase
MPQSALTLDGWRLEPAAQRQLLARMRKAGKPLGEYVHGNFYYGIKTGLNDAFVIDSETRARLIAEHPSSEKVIKPYLRGRDIKRWTHLKNGLFLIYVPWHFPIQADSSIQGASTKAEKAFATNYPAIYRHLANFKKELSARNTSETGIRYEWYALQRWASDYWHLLSEPKIFVPAIDNAVNYCSDLRGHFGNDKTSVIISKENYFLLGILNSSISWWITQQEFASKEGGFFEFKPMYVSQLPIPMAEPFQKKIIERLVRCAEFVSDNKSDTILATLPFIEQMLNGLVYELFFAEELHERKIQLFAAIGETELPDMAAMALEQARQAVTTLHETLAHTNHPVRGMLFDLQGLPLVRMIEGHD